MRGDAEGEQLVGTGRISDVYEKDIAPNLSSGDAVFEDLMYQNLRQSGSNSSDQTTLPTGLQLGLATAGRAMNLPV